MSRPRDSHTRFYKLALTLRDDGKLAEARRCLVQALEEAKKIMPADHPEVKKYQQLYNEITPKNYYDKS